MANPIHSGIRTGIPWEYLPHDFPPFKTVHDHCAKWEADGTTEQVHSLLRDGTRRANARNGEPTAAVAPRLRRRQAGSYRAGCSPSERAQGMGRRRLPEPRDPARRQPWNRRSGSTASTREGLPPTDRFPCALPASAPSARCLGTAEDAGHEPPPRPCRRSGRGAWPS
ncbi:transposase [Streptomyces sp. NPDC085929]|uniref:transposase n=1 Tax=Streptomyces sp. NPDC085929 TaxID=3365739 RepID=UPI0037D71E06